MSIKKIAFVLALFACTFCFSEEEIAENTISEDFSEVYSEIQKNITVIQSSQSHNLNPQTATYNSEIQIIGNLYEGLFSYDPKTVEPLPAIAESYRISRNKRRWTFTLRENAKFSNGQTITAEGVRASWLALLANPSAMYASLFDIITGAKEFRTGCGSAENVGITAKDERTLVVQLNTPASHLNRILCHVAFSVINKGTEGETVYSGAYILAETLENGLVLKKNEFYWDAQQVHIPLVKILFSSDADKNTYAFNTGQADWVCSSINPDKILVKGSLHLNAEFGTQYMFFKSSRKPWNIADFRLALLTAVPWEELRKDNFIKAETFIYPLLGYPQVTGFYETDADEAKDLISEARKKAGISEDEVLELVIAEMSGSYSKKLSAILKKAWEPLGIKVRAEEKKDYEYINAIPDWDADLFSYTWIGDFSDPLAFLELFRGNSTLNVSDYEDAEFDRLLDAAAADETENHLKLLAKAEQMLLDAGVILPISHPVTINALNQKEIGGWFENSLDVHPFKYLYFKKKNSPAANLVKLVQ